jgi:hypothetical protein
LFSGELFSLETTELTSAVLAPTTVVDSEDDLEEIADRGRHPACPLRHDKPGRLIRPTNLIPSNPQAISTAYQQHDTKGILITRKSLGYTHSTVSKAIDFSGKCPTKYSSPPRSKQWNDDQISRLITNFWHSYSFLGDALDRTELEKRSVNSTSPLPSWFQNDQSFDRFHHKFPLMKVRRSMIGWISKSFR